MIFIVVYDRKLGELIGSVREYDDSQLESANAVRLNAELKYARNADVEVVHLRSEDKNELTRTHARYFKTLELLKPAG